VSGGPRHQAASWLLLVETLLAALALLLDSIEAQHSLGTNVADLSSPNSSAFALVVGPLFVLPVLALLVLAAMAVGAKPRVGRWVTLPSQLAAVLVLLISLRGVLEAIAAILMVAVAVLVELLLFVSPRSAGTGEVDAG
jgi:hypothetical protein